MVRRIHKNQRGITLVEMLVVVVIIGLISGGIALLISRTITGSARDSDLMILVRQVQQAGTEVQTDIMQAQCVKSDHESGFPLSLWWKWEETENDVRYELNGTDLMRIHNGQTRRVARYITSASVQPAPHPLPHEGGVLTFTVTASFEGREDEGETRVYEVRPRSHQECPPED